MRTRRPWLREHEDVLRRRYPHEATKRIAADLGRALYQVYAKAARLGLKKTEEYLAGADACRLRRGDNVGAAWRFLPGHVPANKGVRRPMWAPGRMAETQFKKGQKSCNWVPVGTEIVKCDGYLYRKMTDTGCPRRDWKQVHRLLWEQAYGQIPPGYFVKFIDGNRRNVVMENLCLVTRQDLAALNRMWNIYPRELAEVIQLRGALKRVINRRSQRNEKQDRRSA